MDIRALQMFRAVARTGSVAAAAEEVHSVTSNVSVQVRKLEEEFTLPLFLRESRGMRLTPAGERLLDYAERILALADEAREAMREVAGAGGRLRLGSMETAAAVRLPPLLAAFHRAYPKVCLTLTTGPSETNVQAVLDRTIDIAFVGGPVHHELLIGQAVFVEELVLAVPAGVRGIRDANTRAMLVFRAGCAYRARTETWLRQRGEPPRAVMEFGTLEGLLGCIAAGMGVSLLPRVIVGRPQHAGEIAALPIADNRVETWMIRHKDAIDTGAVRAFLATVAGFRDCDDR